jgi:hypothetical protein
MPVYDPHPKRPGVLQPFVAPQLMVHPRKHRPQLVGIDQAQDLPHAVGTRFLLPDQPFHSSGLAQLPFHGM